MMRIYPLLLFVIAFGFFLPTSSQAQDRRTPESEPANESPQASPLQYPPITVITGISLTRADLGSFNSQIRDQLVQQLGGTALSGSEKSPLALSGEFGLGWRVNRYFAAELALGGTTSATTRQKGRIHDATGDWGFELHSSANAFAVHLSFVGTLPLGESFEVFGRLGAAANDSEVKTTLRCVEDCTVVPQHDGHPAYCDLDGKNCVEAKPDSPPTTYARRATFNDGRSILPVIGAGLRWHAFRLEYRAMRVKIGQREEGNDGLFVNQPRLQLSGDQNTLVQTVLFSYVWGAGSTW